MSINLYDTGEIIYSEIIPFKIPFLKDFQYSQTNAIFEEISNYNLNDMSSVFTSNIDLDVGKIINVKCFTNSCNEISLNLFRGGLSAAGTGAQLLGGEGQALGGLAGAGILGQGQERSQMFGGLGELGGLLGQLGGLF